MRATKKAAQIQWKKQETTLSPSVPWLWNCQGQPFPEPKPIQTYGELLQLYRSPLDPSILAIFSGNFASKLFKR